MDMPNTLAELGELHRSRPGAEAGPIEVAAWYERKAQVFEHLAAQGSRTAAVHAEIAHRHAAELAEGVAA